MIQWRWKAFRELSLDELYEALKLRQDVFAIEQKCYYNDLDDFDQPSLHLFGRDAGGALVAYLRVLPPGARYEEPSIGRVVTSMAVRGTGTGKALMLEGIRKARETYPGRAIRIAAQHRLQGFYARLGFVPEGDPYKEDDGIVHVYMTLPTSTAS